MAKPIGEILVDRGKVTRAQLEQALRESKQWKVPVGDVLMANGAIRSFEFYAALAEQLGLRFVDLAKEPPDNALLKKENIADCSQLMSVPWRRVDGKVVVVTCRQGPAVEAFATRLFGAGNYEIAITSQFDIQWTLQKVFGNDLTDRSLNALYEQNPQMSARVVFDDRQLFGVLVLLAAVLFCLHEWPVPTLIGINLFIAVFYLCTFGLRALLSWKGSARIVEYKINDTEVAGLSDAELPVYTVLVPMYKEPEVLPILANALRRMDYPRAKLDIKLLLEEGDNETIEAAKRLRLESIFEIVRVPPSQPQTKPKACNYGLHFARGELVTIFDAEDKPDPDQLKKVVLAFRKAPKHVVCLQCRLNYFNRDENWLTKMFTLEYSMWFDLLLPGLERMGIPIPLGGTSNHFRTEVLRDLGAWDPYNVTEDADLGVRLNQRGYSIQVVNSTTMEEAVTRPGIWIKQRSRWLKGYMQTYLVHMRKPWDLYRKLGAVGFWGFQFFIGGTVLCALLNPVMWILFVGWVLGLFTNLEQVFPPLVVSIALFNLLIGNLSMIYFFMLGAYKRGYYNLIVYALTAPIYWTLFSIAGYKGFWQLIHNPFYWEKTQHGVSKHTARELAAAAKGG